MKKMEYMIEKAKKTDLEQILELQRRAFIPVAKAEGKKDILPLRQTYEEILEESSAKLFLKCIVDNKIIGSVRAYLEDNICYVGKLIVDPDFQKHGMGSKLMVAIEKEFAEAKKVSVFTSKSSEGTIRLYEKLGYKIVDRFMELDVPMVRLEKLHTQ